MAAAGLRLHPACRVRQERFGLLFYDSRGPRLLFAETGDLIPADAFQGLLQMDELPAKLSDSEQVAVKHFLSKLVERGFLREQPVC